MKEAGIRPLILTGDQEETARAVGRQLNLSENGEPTVLDWSTLEDKDDPDSLRERIHQADVFSRVNPTDKFEIVRALQHDGALVAMTGDGINHGPALKAADVGIAMGEGSEVAQGVADVVLGKNELDTIVTGIQLGRSIFDDIRKSVRFMVSTNFSEILLTLLMMITRRGTPLNPRQLLWINILTDVFPELALATEPPEEDVLKRPPRASKTPIVSGRDWAWMGLESGFITSSAAGAYGVGARRYGSGERANTMAFLSLTAAQLLHAITSRSEDHSIFHRDRIPENRLIGPAIDLGLFVEMLSVVFPGFRCLLGTSVIAASDVLVILGSAGLNFLALEGLKYISSPDTGLPGG